MEKMKINSKTGYRKSRVKSGYGPHRMLEMIQQIKLGESVNEENHEKDSNSNLKEEEIMPSYEKFEEVKK